MVVPREGDPPALEFAVLGVEPVADAGAQVAPAAIPPLRCSLRIDAGERSLKALALNVRIQIRAEQRRYSASESERLWELFGPVECWGRSLGPVKWTSTTLDVSPFTGATRVALDLPSALDSEAGACRYLAAVEAGYVPLELLFSGTLSWAGDDGRMQTAMIPWDREATFRMPVAVLRQGSLRRPGAQQR